MATSRFDELERKRDDVGLTDDEANELGRLMAERAGRPYGNAETRVHHDAGPHAWKAAERDRQQEGVQPEPSRETTAHPVNPESDHFLPAKGGHAPETGDPLVDDLQDPPPTSG